MKKAILSLCLILNAGMATAGVAVKNAACANKASLNHPQGSSGVYFDIDCKTAYVLPPAASRVEISAIAPTANIQQCAVVNNLMAMQKATADQLAAALGPQKKSAASSFDPNQGGAVDGALAPTGDVNGLSADQIAQQAQLIKSYMALSQQYQEIISLYKDVPAASAIVKLSVPWDQLVMNYQQQNKNLGISFMRMPLDSASLTFNREVSKVGSLPAVLDYDIPGIASASDGLNDSTPASSRDTSLLVGEAYSGQLVLSLIGACPFYNTSTGEIEATGSGRSMSADLNANLNYSYDLQVYRKYDVSYDLSLLVKHIHESESHCGFFSTSTSTTEIDSTENNDWFIFKSDSNDARYSYDILIPEIKADLMNRAIRDIGMASGYNPGDLPQVRARTQDGAQATSAALQECPNEYCQAGALALKALDAIFGSSSAVSTYINSKHAVAGDHVEEDKSYRFFGSSSFAPVTPGYSFGG